MNVIEYGPDGCTLVAFFQDNNDGTGTRTTYNPDGTVASVETITDLPIDAPPTPDPLHVLAQAIVEATSLDDVKVAAQAILDDGDVTL